VEEYQAYEEIYRGVGITLDQTVIDGCKALGQDAIQAIRDKIDDYIEHSRTFSDALWELKKGNKVARREWDSNVHLYLNGNGEFYYSALGVEFRATLRDEDILADDWFIVA
jgi:hypothetical protein